MKDRIKAILYKYIKELRKERGTSFLFYPVNVSFEALVHLLLYEAGGKYEKSDEVLIALVFRDLINKKILSENCLKYFEYRLNEIVYYDVYLKTTEDKFFCRGTSTDKSTAYAKALGEVFERTSIKFPSQDEKLVEMKVSETKENPDFLDLELFAKPTDKQVQKFKNFVVNSEDAFTYLKTRNVLEDREVYLPAQTVYYGNFLNKKEKKIVQSTTNGAGAGFSPEGAYLSGLLEILHRHYFLKSWYFKRSPDVINLKSLEQEKELSYKVKNFLSRDFKIYFLDYTVEAGIPTSICILERFGGWYCGGSSSYKLSKALERALDEAMSTYLWCEQTNLEGRNKIDEKYVESISGDFMDERMNSVDRILAFADKSFVEKLDKFIVLGHEVEYTTKFDLTEVSESLDLQLKKEGFLVFVHERQNSYLSEYGYFVSKVVIPNSYYFALDEIFSRAVIDGKVPTYTEPNPFP